MTPSDTPWYTKSRLGEVGELMLEQWLERNGYEVFPDVAKKVNRWGIDRVAYDPRTHRILLIDNGAQARALNKASGALSFDRLFRANLRDVEEVLDRATGFSEQAREAFYARRYDVVVSNFHPENLATRFSRQVFSRNWLALDAVTGRLYSSWDAFTAARAQHVPQGGFASVGGMLFTLVSIGGIVVAISTADTLDERVEVVAGATATAGVGFVAGRLMKSGFGGVIVSILIGLKDDQGEPSKEELEAERVYEFLDHFFTREQIAAGGDRMRAEAHELLFGTRPLVLVPDPVGDGSEGARLAMQVIEQLDKGDGWLITTDDNVLLSALFNAIKNKDVCMAFYDVLHDKLRPDGTDYFAWLMEKVEAVLPRSAAKLADKVAELLGESDARDGTDDDVPNEPGWGVVLRTDEDIPAGEEIMEPGLGVLLPPEERPRRASSGEAADQEEPATGRSGLIERLRQAWDVLTLKWLASSTAEAKLDGAEPASFPHTAEAGSGDAHYPVAGALPLDPAGDREMAELGGATTCTEVHRDSLGGLGAAGLNPLSSPASDTSGPTIARGVADATPLSAPNGPSDATPPSPPNGADEDGGEPDLPRDSGPIDMATADLPGLASGGGRDGVEDGNGEAESNHGGDSGGDAFYPVAGDNAQEADSDEHYPVAGEDDVYPVAEAEPEPVEVEDTPPVETEEVQADAQSAE